MTLFLCRAQVHRGSTFSFKIRMEWKSAVHKSQFTTDKMNEGEKIQILETKLGQLRCIIVWPTLHLTLSDKCIAVSAFKKAPPDIISQGCKVLITNAATFVSFLISFIPP